MGKPLNEPTKLLGFIPFSDAVLMFLFMAVNAGFSFIVAQVTKGFFAMIVFMGFTVLLIVVFVLKNIFPAGFFPGLFRHLTKPRLKIPGRERSEI